MFGTRSIGLAGKCGLKRAFMGQKGVAASPGAGVGPYQHDHMAEGFITMAQNDIREAQGTYAGFVSLFKWGALATAIVTAFVMLIIS